METLSIIRQSTEVLKGGKENLFGRKRLRRIKRTELCYWTRQLSRNIFIQIVTQTGMPRGFLNNETNSLTLLSTLSSGWNRINFINTEMEDLSAPTTKFSFGNVRDQFIQHNSGYILWYLQSHFVFQIILGCGQGILLCLLWPQQELPLWLPQINQDPLEKLSRCRFTMNDLD